MRFFAHVAILFYLAIICFVGVLAIAFANNAVSMGDVVYYLISAQASPNLSIAITAISALVVFLSFLFARILLGGQQKERTIAFENPSGRVSITLNALEDMVRRAILDISEVKEIKPSMIATKKGIEVTCRLVLKSDGNIPDMTLKIQDLIKGQLQDVLGIEENVVVLIHITKIIAQADKNKAAKVVEPEEKPQISVPFQGYRK